MEGESERLRGVLAVQCIARLQSKGENWGKWSEEGFSLFMVRVGLGNFTFNSRLHSSIPFENGLLFE